MAAVTQQPIFVSVKQDGQEWHAIYHGAQEKGTVLEGVIVIPTTQHLSVKIVNQDGWDLTVTHLVLMVSRLVNQPHYFEDCQL